MRSQTPNITLSPTALSPSSFASFGEVISNPSTHDEVDGNGQWRLEHQIANQGTATKWLDITHLNNWYERALSRKAAKVVVNMFVCKPRTLSRVEGKKVFKVSILERHPFTGQTFVPLGVDREDADNRRYLVIVAPTLPSASRFNGDRVEKPYPVDNAPRVKKRSLKERLLGARPNPFTNDYVPSTTTASTDFPVSQRPKGSGLPDLQNIRAFIAKGDQAVTYGPGTWHAPMVVLGKKEIEFVVVQYANGVGNEDCQECDIDAVNGEGIVVDVGNDAIEAADVDGSEASKPGYMRAKL